MFTVHGWFELERLVGYCGIIYSECPVLMVAQKNDDVERKRVAEIFTKQYGKAKETLDEIKRELSVI